MPVERYMDPEERGARTELLEAALRLVVVAGGEFPTDAHGLRRLVEKAGYEDEERGGPVRFEYEPPAELPRYTGDFQTWVGHAEDGGLRLRLECRWLRAVAAELRPDGTVSELTLQEGFGTGAEEEDRLTEQARTDLATVRRKREAFEASEREYLAAEPEFRGDRLLKVVTAPWQDPSGLVITWLALFDDGLIVNYHFHDPGESDMEEGFPSRGVDLWDNRGTSYSCVDSRSIPWSSLVSASQIFTPAVPEGVTYLIARSDSGPVEIELGD